MPAYFFACPSPSRAYVHRDSKNLKFTHHIPKKPPNHPSCVAPHPRDAPPFAASTPIFNLRPPLALLPTQQLPRHRLPLHLERYILCRHLAPRSRVPVTGVPDVALLPMQVRMRPRAVPAVVVLCALMRSVPIPTPVVPQRLQRPAQPRRGRSSTPGRLLKFRECHLSHAVTRPTPFQLPRPQKSFSFFLIFLFRSTPY